MFLHVILGVEMKKLVLCGAVLTAMAMTACSTTNGGLAKPVVPVVSQENVADLTELKKSVEAELATENKTLKSLSVKVANKEYKDGKINFAEFGQGIHNPIDASMTFVATDKATNTDETMGSKGKLYLFQQNYSMVAAVETTHNIENGKEIAVKDSEEEIDFFVSGEVTKNLPTKGNYKYVGTAHIYDGTNNRIDTKFSYDVNFETAKGSGKVENVAGKDINLAETSITDLSSKNAFDDKVLNYKGFNGTATRDGKQGWYELGLFGKDADEVIGRVSVDNHEYDGFIGGKKQ